MRLAKQMADCARCAETDGLTHALVIGGAKMLIKCYFFLPQSGKATSNTLQRERERERDAAPPRAMD